MRDGIVRNAWLEAEDKLLLELYGEGLPWEVIAPRFRQRHGRAACEQRVVVLRRRLGISTPKPQRRWSAEHNAELIRRGDAGEPFEVIGQGLQRTRFACKIQYHSLKRHGLEPPRNKLTIREAAMVKAAEVKLEVAALPPRSLTAEFCGDPLPGRSALDKKRAGIIDDDPPRVDYRYADLRPKPTLAGVA